jgi:hypothetical protein
LNSLKTQLGTMKKLMKWRKIVVCLSGDSLLSRKLNL